ncbi:MAG: ParB N-terminal domain-containing protein [Nitrospirae bacterium]|nr:ParB N-terminal domain-containing protein [Nitrospirota bacterium]
MLTTKRYEYLTFEAIQIHPDIKNHRSIDLRKVTHYEQDIIKNGLLEPLVVWEKKHQEYYLVGGFHRMAAIRNIRINNIGYFDRIDVRVVSGDFDEIVALNLKLNADRVDTKITDFFDIIIYLNNANWDKQRISSFIDRSVSFIEEIIRYAPGMDSKVRALLSEGRITWTKAKAICKAVLDAPAGSERDVLNAQLKAITENPSSADQKKRPLTFKSAKGRISKHLKTGKPSSYTINTKTLLSLLLVLEGKSYEDAHVEQIKEVFPGLFWD